MVDLFPWVKGWETRHMNSFSLWYPSASMLFRSQIVSPSWRDSTPKNGEVCLFQRVPSSAALADLHQVVVARQLSQMRFDGIAVCSRGFLDFLDRDFSSRLCE